MHAIDRRDTNQFADLVKDAFDHAALSTLPTVSYIAKKPWISRATLDLIKQRDVHRRSNEYDQEKSLNVQIRHSAKRDRAS